MNGQDSHQTARNKIVHYVLVFVGCSVWFCLLGFWLGPDKELRIGQIKGEEIKYLTMAGWNPPADNTSLINFPSRFRILVPFLARSLPHAPVSSFRFLSLASMVVGGILLFSLFLQLGLSTVESYSGLAIFATLFYPSFYYSQHPFMPDPLFFCFWFLGIHFILRRKIVWLVILMALAVLIKETIVFLTGACFVLWFDREKILKTALVAFLVAVPALFIYLGFREFYGFSGSYHGVFEWAVLILSDRHFLRNVLSGLLLSGALFWFVALARWKWIPTQAQRRFLAGALSVFPLVFLASDSGRQLAKFSPFWIPFVLSAISFRLGSKSYWLSLSVIILGNLSLAAIAIIQFTFSTELYLRMAASVLLIILFGFFTWRRKPDPSQDPKSLAEKEVDAVTAVQDKTISAS